VFFPFPTLLLDTQVNVTPADFPAGVLALLRRAKVTGEEMSEELLLTALWLQEQW